MQILHLYIRQQQSFCKILDLYSFVSLEFTNFSDNFVTNLNVFTYIF